MNNSLIKDPAERLVRRDEKRRAILRFLRDETWSTADVLGLVAGIGTRQGIHKTLTAMERDELVKRHKLPIAGRVDLTCWGITPHGVGMSHDAGEDFEDRPSFEPSRLALSRVPHQLDLQRARLVAEAHGWTDWVRGERLGFKVECRPDAVATDPAGNRVAIEVERTIKTRKRYQTIITEHLKQRQAGHWKFVLYLSPPGLAPRLQSMFHSVDFVIIQGERVLLKPEIIDAVFKFKNLADWEQDYAA